MRLRRLRRSGQLRKTLQEVDLSLDQLVLPVFVTAKDNWEKEISSMPNIYQFSLDLAAKHVAEMAELGVGSFIFFGIPETKDFEGKGAADPKGPVPEVLRLIRQNHGDSLSLYADVCLCEYTTHGHCGIPDDDGKIQNDISLTFLADAALAYAEAGADWVAPSNMMDRRVSSIRQKLDNNGYEDTAILSYSAKYASNYYGPFRDAAESPPQFGDRRTYQIDFRSITQGMREVRIDINQGADAVMVKPALSYLDMIRRIRQDMDLPLFTYNVSGEYSMVKLGAKAGYFDEEAMVLENLLAMRRAGADAIISYHTVDIAKNRWL